MFFWGGEMMYRVAQIFMLAITTGLTEPKETNKGNILIMISKIFPNMYMIDTICTNNPHEKFG